MKVLKHISFLLIVAASTLFSCENNSFNTDRNATLEFSTDTVTFDTIFSEIGSTTLHLMVYNTYDDDLEINSIFLEGGAASEFRINIDGSPDELIENKLLRANDSMYIFVEVTIDPLDKSLPFLVEDNIVFNTNGAEQRVVLEAYGQDAHHITLGKWANKGYTLDAENQDTIWFVLIDKDTTLTSDKPYFLHDDLFINEDTKLTLEPGTQFFIQSKKTIYIAGSIHANGTIDAPILFRGHRSDDVYEGLSYDKIPGQWGTISLQPTSKDNIFTHTNIRNAINGLSIYSLSTTNSVDVKVKNCRIENMTGSAVLCFDGNVESENSLFANCGTYLFGTVGGSHDFTNCTFGNYYDTSIDKKNRTEPSIVITNIYPDGETAAPIERANFTNCIIDGSSTEELSLLQSAEVISEFNFNFDHCLIKTKVEKIDTNDVRFNEVIWNKDPLFINPKEDWNFYPDTLSPVIDYGIDTHLKSDITETSYTLSPDLGAFEFTKAKEN